MLNSNEKFINSPLSNLCGELEENNKIPSETFVHYGVKRGLRNPDGTGVLAGITKVCNVHGYVMSEGEKTSVQGKLTYRGVDVSDIVNACKAENRFGFEEVVWLLLFGTLPTEDKLLQFHRFLSENRELPEYFAEDMIIKAPSPNVMNKLSRSVLALYSYDDNPDDTSVENLLRQSIMLIAQLPTVMVYAYQVKRRQYEHKTMYFHPIDPSHWTAEFILSSMRSDRKFTDEEAKLLDLCLCLHAEHGGGNNSAFAARVLSSSGTDTYSAIAASIGALKGPKHGGANVKVNQMLEMMKESISGTSDEEVKSYLEKVLRRQAGDGTGLIYGMGHAVYTLSDPRCVILKKEAERAAANAGLSKDFELLSKIERIAPKLLCEYKGIEQDICANVDLYSGLIYRALKIPEDLFTPIFAIARMAGWCAHRIEEVTTSGKIIRPAYKSIVRDTPYIPIDQR
ncbi:MAG: citrate synthase [Acutalibacteraceae bacterium]